MVYSAMMLRYNGVMNLIQKLQSLFHSRIPITEEHSTSDYERFQQVVETPEISEEFKKRVSDFIEQYREALEALAKK